MPMNLVLAAVLAARTVAATPCTSSANQMLTSCRAEVQADDQRALAICTNVAESGARRACQRDAAREKNDASTLCNEQYDARLDACRLLGGGAYDPDLRPSRFVDGVDNPYFPLVPGTTYTYASSNEIDVVTVTHRTREIAGVTCIEVHDVSSVDGAVAEDTLDWFAQDRDGNVWYFGESSTQIEDGRVVGTEGSWLSGVDGGKAGIIMEASPRVGDAYRQEFLFGVAEDIGRVVDIHAFATVPFGSFTNCVSTEDTSSLEPDAVEMKFYAAGIGSVLEVDPASGERLELISVTTE